MTFVGCGCGCGGTANVVVTPETFDSLDLYFRSLPEDGSVFLQELPALEREAIANRIPKDKNRYSINRQLDIGHVSVEMIFYPRKNKSHLFCWVEQVEQSNAIAFWEFSPSGIFVRVKAIDVLPELTVNHFLGDDVNLGPYKGTMLYSLTPDGNIGVELHRWMEPELENVHIQYEVELTWDGAKFNIKRKPIKVP